MSIFGDVIDFGLNVFTLGGYSVVKGAVNDGTEELTNIGVDITNDISEITNQALTVMGDADSILVGMDRLFATKLAAERSYNDFSPDEKAAWDDTITKIQTLYKNLEYLGSKVNLIIPADDRDLKDYLNDNFSGIPLIPIKPPFSTITVPSFKITIGGANVMWPSFQSKPGSIDNVLGTIKPLIKAYATQIFGVRAIQNKLSWYGPGPLPETIIKVQAIVDDFNTDLQPKIDTLLTNANDTLQVTNKVLGRVNAEEQPRIEKLLDTTNGTLIDTQKVLTRFNTEEQPRIEKLLDNVNTTVSETQVVLKNVDQTIAETKVTMTDLDMSIRKIKGGLDLVSKYKTPILIVIGATTLLWVAISILTVLLLLKLLLGPNPL